MQRSLRVLCTSTGGAGHVGALAPVAEALRDRGHEVQWAVAPDGAAAVGQMGFVWHAAGLPTQAASRGGRGRDRRDHAVADVGPPGTVVRRLLRPGRRTGDATRAGTDHRTGATRHDRARDGRTGCGTDGSSARHPARHGCLQRRASRTRPAVKCSKTFDRSGRRKGSTNPAGPMSTDSCISTHFPSRSVSSRNHRSCARCDALVACRALRLHHG